MPNLSWIAKDKVVNHHKDLPFRVLKSNSKLSVGERGNLLIHGDNLEALKALMPYYYGKIKCAYLDPPYNTNNDKWVYNDRVNSPQIKQWLKKTVGAEGEDLCRHDKWLCMIYPRLQLTHELLKEDGVVFISINSIELANLQAVMDEIFGRINRVGIIVWKNATDNNPTNISDEHEYILCYAKNKSLIPSEWKSSSLEVKDKLMEVGNKLISEQKDLKKLQNEYTAWYRANRSFLWPFEDYKFIDKGGVYTGSRSVHNPGKEGYRYDVIHPVTGKPCVQPFMGYRFPEETMKRLTDEKRIIFGSDETKIVELKVYARDYRAKLPSVIDLDGRRGTNEIKQIFPEKKRAFDFPKPSILIEELISFVTSGDDIVLDSFAGSGTTGHAVLNLNKADKGNRRFILVELEEKIAKEITAERLKRVINGYPESRFPKGTGQGFEYLDLNGELFDKNGLINKKAGYEDLAPYVYFSETHDYLDPSVIEAPYLGIHGSRHYFLFYKGKSNSVFNAEGLAEVIRHKGAKVVFAEKSLLDDETYLKHNIVFKQIPYELKQF
jgi:DNA modification methylase